MATKREKIQIKNGTKKSEKKAFDSSKAQVSKKPLKVLQVELPGKGWTPVTAPTTQKVIDGVKRVRNRKYRVLEHEA